MNFKILGLFILFLLLLLTVGSAQLDFTAFVGLVIVTASVLSLFWTTWKARRVLRKALGRKLRDEEETSIKTWMTLSDSDLDTAAGELRRNPFESIADLGLPGGLADHKILDLDQTTHSSDDISQSRTESK